MGPRFGEEQATGVYSKVLSMALMKNAGYPFTFPVGDLLTQPSKSIAHALRGFFHGYRNVSKRVEGNVLKLAYVCRATRHNSGELNKLYKALTNTEVNVAPGTRHTLELVVDSEFGPVEFETSIPGIKVRMPQEMLEAAGYDTATAIRAVIR